MSKEQDDRIIGTMHATLHAYTEHGYPVEYGHKDKGPYSFAVLTISSPLTGKLLLTKMSMAGTSTSLYRMDHEDMVTPEDLILNYQEDFSAMYRLGMAYYMTKAGHSANNTRVN